jgi:hypothetical protein
MGQHERGLKRGEQIAYVPTHVHGDLNHPDVQFGFVTSGPPDNYFCRYWVSKTSQELRTKANSESTPTEYLVECVSHTLAEVKAALKEYC